MIAIIVLAVAVPLSRCGGMIAAEFSGIGFLRPNDNVSYADAVSSDGSIVAGLSFREYTSECPTTGNEFHWTYRRGYVWSAERGMRALDPNADSEQIGYDEIYDVSRNGDAVLGASFGTIQYFCGTPVGSYDSLGRFRWAPSSGIVATEEGISPQSFGGDENVYAGKHGVISYWGATTAFRHTPTAGVQELGWLRWGDARIDDFNGPTSAATGISADGEVVVGNSTSAASYEVVGDFIVSDLTANLSEPTPPFNFPASKFNTEAFRWTADGGMIGLGDLPGGDFGSIATGVSGNGQTIIGASAAEHGQGAFRWTQETGMVQIDGLLPGGLTNLNAVSFYGSRIIGSSTASAEFVPTYYGGYYVTQRAAILWDEENGVRNLKYVLEQDYGLDLAGWQLLSANDISYDGLTIVGTGINPLGQEEGWIVRLNPIPEPTAALLLIIAVFCVLAVRRRQFFAAYQTG